MQVDEPSNGSRPRRWTRWVRRLVLYPVLGLVVLALGAFGFVMATRYPQGPPQEGAMALTGATVLIGDDLEPERDATVLMRDGVIEAVGPRGEVDVPHDAETLDLDGATLLPGLIDLHVHLFAPQIEAGEEFGWQQTPRAIVDGVRHHPGPRRDMLAHGVTAFRSLGDHTEAVLEVRRMVADGELEGPRAFVAGPLFTAPEGHPVVTLHGGQVIDGVVEVPGTPAEARDAVRQLASADGGVDLIKVVHDRGGPQLSIEPIASDVLEAIVDEAHAHDLPVVAHWGAQHDLEELLAVGVDGGLEHFDLRPPMLEAWPEDLLASLVERDVPLGATLAVTEAGMAERRPEIWAQMRERFAELHDAGGRIVAGSDAPMNGLGFGDGLHRELEVLVEFGLAPVEALRAATSEAAEALRTDEIGVIEPGRAADLLAVDGDPLDDISAIRDVRAVWRDGRLVTGSTDRDAAG